jgi:hypothetical protein
MTTNVLRQCLFLQQFSTNSCKNSRESYSYNSFLKKTFIMLFTIIKIVFYCFYVIFYSMMINYMLCIWRNVYRSIKWILHFDATTPIGWFWLFFKVWYILDGITLNSNHRKLTLWHGFYVIFYSMMINYMLCIWRNVYRSI